MPSHPFRTPAATAPAPRPSWAWVGLFAAPLAWAVHIGARYPLVPVACASGSSLALHAVSLGCAAVATLGLVAAAITARRSASGIAQDEAHPLTTRRRGRIGLVARAGVVGSAIFLGAILLEASAALVLDPCTRGLS